MNARATAFLMICCMAGASFAATIEWTDWQTFERPIPPGVFISAQGTIGGAVDVTYAGSAWSVLTNCISGDYWTEPEPTNAPYTGSALVDNRPPCDAIRLKWAASHTITFSEPVWMPLMAIATMGDSSHAVTYDFGAGVQFSVLSEGEGSYGDGTYTLGDGSLTGIEFHGVIQFDGWVDQISLTSSGDEVGWHGFTFGLAPDPVSTPIAIAETNLLVTTASNAVYTLLSATHLTNTFSAFTNFPGDGATNSIPISIDDPQRFYKALKVE